MTSPSRAPTPPGRRARLVGFIALGTVVTCAPDIEPWLRVPRTRATLFRGLPSYTSPTESLRRLRLSDAPRTDKVRKGKSQGCLSRSFRYAVRVVTLEAADEGYSGALVLTFLEDKLVRTEFRPHRGRAYVERLLARAALSSPLPLERLKKSMRLSGAPAHTRVEVVRHGEGLAVVWSDTRLLKAYWEVQARGSSRYM